MPRQAQRTKPVPRDRGGIADLFWAIPLHPSLRWWTLRDGDRCPFTNNPQLHLHNGQVRGIEMHLRGEWRLLYADANAENVPPRDPTDAPGCMATMGWVEREFGRKRLQGFANPVYHERLAQSARVTRQVYGQQLRASVMTSTGFYNNFTCLLPLNQCRPQWLRARWATNWQILCERWLLINDLEDELFIADCRTGLTPVSETFTTKLLERLMQQPVLPQNAPATLAFPPLPVTALPELAATNFVPGARFYDQPSVSPWWWEGPLQSYANVVAIVNAIGRRLNISAIPVDAQPPQLARPHLWVLASDVLPHAQAENCELEPWAEALIQDGLLALNGLLAAVEGNIQIACQAPQAAAANILRRLTEGFTAMQVAAATELPVASWSAQRLRAG